MPTRTIIRYQRASARGIQRVIVVGIALMWSGTALGDHRILLQGNQRLAILHPDQSVDWEMPWGPIHDLHRLPDGHLLLPDGKAKIVELDPATKEVVRSYDSAVANGNAGREVEVHAFQPLENDRWMIAESGPGRIIEVDRDGHLLKEFPLKLDHPHPHMDTRLVRKLADGHYLVAHEGDGCVREYSDRGEVIWEFPIPLFGRAPADGHGPEAYGNKVFSAIRLANGNTLIGTGNGHRVLEVSPDKRIVWRLEQNEIPGVVLAWVTTVERLPNGNYLIGNCHAGPGQPVLIEVEPATKKLVWRLDAYPEFGNDVSNTLRISSDEENES